VGDEEPELGAAGSWIGVVPVGEEPAEGPRAAREESFTAAVVSKVTAPGPSWGVRSPVRGSWPVLGGGGSLAGLLGSASPAWVRRGPLV